MVNIPQPSEDPLFIHNVQYGERLNMNNVQYYPLVFKKGHTVFPGWGFQKGNTVNKGRTPKFTPFTKGHKLTPEGKDHWNWKGDIVSYGVLHKYVRRNKPKPKSCEQCKIRPAYDLTNISGSYLRDLNDWRYLCRKCHMIEDGRINNLTYRFKEGPLNPRWRDRNVTA